MFSARDLRRLLPLTLLALPWLPVPAAQPDQPPSRGDDAAGVAASEADASAAAVTTIDEEISIITEDGVRLSGLLVRPEGGGPAPLVILLHPFGGDRDGLLPLADALAQAGFAAAVTDLRGHGQSNATVDYKRYTFEILPQSALTKAVGDQLQLLRQLSARPEIDAGRIALIGVSEGGQVAGAAAARAPEVRALVVVDPVGRLSFFDPGADLGLLGARPALLICSSGPRSRAQAELLAEYGAGERSVDCVEGYATGDDLLVRGAPALEEIKRWLAAHLLPD